MGMLLLDNLYHMPATRRLVLLYFACAFFFFPLLLFFGMKKAQRVQIDNLHTPEVVRDPTEAFRSIFVIELL